MKQYESTKSQKSEVLVLKVNLPLANKSLFFRVTHPNHSISEIMEQGIEELRKEGKEFEANQVSEMLQRMK
jgi:hypothetical protein